MSHHHCESNDKHCSHSHDCSHHEDDSFSHQLLVMADEAWMEVLKEKIKAQIVAKSGKRLDQLAKLVADSNEERWKFKISKHNIIDDFRQNLAKFFRHEK